MMNSIPFFSLEYQHGQIRKQMEEAFSRQLDKSRFVLDEEVDAFEREFAAYHGINYCIGVANGLDALYICLKSLGIGVGDEVLVPSHTFFATWLAVSRTGARPMAVEVSTVDYNLDVALIEKKITNKTKAIIPVHLYGHPCAMDDIVALAGKYDLKIIEDNAQAHGATLLGKKAGSWGHINAVSFYPTKNMGALGDGGAILTNDKSLYAFAKAYRNYGSTEKDIYQQQGINSRLDEVQAAVLRIKLEHLDEWNKARIKIANYYTEELGPVGDLIMPAEGDDKVSPVFHHFVIRTDHRDELKKHLEVAGIGSAIHYPNPIHLQEAYKYLGYRRGDLPIAERLSKTVLSLPVWPGLREDEVALVVDSIRAFF